MDGVGGTDGRGSGVDGDSYRKSGNTIATCRSCYDGGDGSTAIKDGMLDVIATKPMPAESRSSGFEA